MKTSNSLAEILEKLGFGKFHYWVFIVCGTAWMQDMLAAINISILIIDAGSSYGITDSQRTYFPPWYHIGMTLGSYLGGYISDRYGRMTVFKKSAMVSVLAGICLVFSYEPISLLLGIFLFGLGAGTEVAIGGVVFEEFLPPSKEWLLFNLSAFWSGGAATAALIAVVLYEFSLPLELWKCCIGVNVVFCLFSFGIRLSFRETPLYSYSKGDLEETKETLNWMAKWNRKEIERIELERREENFELKELDRPLLVKPTKISIWSIWKGENFRKTTTFSIIYVCFNFGSSFFYFYMPELLSETGIIGWEIFFVVFCQNIVGVFGVLIFSRLIEGPLGRKYTSMIPVLLEVVCVLTFLVTDNFWVLIVTTSLSEFLGYVTWSGLYTITPESYETSVRNYAVGWANACSKIGGIIGPLICGYILKEEKGFYWSILFAAVMMAVTGCMLSFVKETRGKNLINEVEGKS